MRIKPQGELRQRQPAKKCKPHLQAIAGLPCCACFIEGQTQAAHVNYAAARYGKRWRGKGEKADDRWTVPLCVKCHDEQGRMSERAFWRLRNINPLDLARRLWECCGDIEAMRNELKTLHSWDLEDN